MDVSIALQPKIASPSGVLTQSPQNLHINPDVNITGGDLRRAEENMSTVATRTIDPDGTLAAVGGGAVKGDFTALVAVGRINWPYGLIPPVFEIVLDLGKGEGEERKGEKSSFAEHCCE